MSDHDHMLPAPMLCKYAVFASRGSDIRNKRMPFYGSLRRRAKRGVTHKKSAHPSAAIFWSRFALSQKLAMRPLFKSAAGFTVNKTRSKHMSRHTDNLKRLIQELQVRYGDDDAVVLPIKQELVFCEGMEARYLRRSIPYLERRLDRFARLHRNIVSASAAQATSSR